MDTTDRCKEGSSQHAVCLRNNGLTALKNVNPWLGGYWNPYEGCDTKMGGIAATEEVFYSHCSDVLCATDNTFFARMPKPGKGAQELCDTTSSKIGGGQTVNKVGMSNIAPDNLCFRKPELSVTCDHPGTMLSGMTGSAMDDLYNHDRQLSLPGVSAYLQKAGRGLFMHGGNPLYYTKKGSVDAIASGVHSVLNINKQDLGGHHIVMRVDVSGNMYVDRTPLKKEPSFVAMHATPSETAYIHSLGSTKTHGDEGWLSNLRTSMQVFLLPLHFISYFTGITKKQD